MSDLVSAEHDFVYIIGDPGDYIIRCLCGWITGGHDTPATAREAFYAHARGAS